MTIWVILDTTNTVINVVDDQNGTVPVMHYVVGQTQLDIKTCPHDVWCGHRLVGNHWIPQNTNPMLTTTLSTL
jgi:hypothetical protein